MSQPYFCGSVINLDGIISYIAFWLIEVFVKFWDCHLLIFFVICLQHAAAKSPRHVANLQRCLVKLADNAAFIGLQPNPKRHGDPGESWDRLSTSKGQEIYSKRPTICPNGNDDIMSNDSHIYFCLNAYQTGMISGQLQNH